MVDDNQESLEVNQPTETNARHEEQQSLLLKLAERTVLQAEALAQEIAEHARQEGETEGARLLAQYAEQAKSEADEAIELAKRRAETIINEATAQALIESEEILKKARSEGEDMLAKAQVEAREILGRAQQEAVDIVKASQARADGTESDARLKAEFVVRQTTQIVADGIRSAVLETCNKILPTVNKLEIESLEIRSDAHYGEDGDPDELALDSPPDAQHTDAESPQKPPGRRARTPDKP